MEAQSISPDKLFETNPLFDPPTLKRAKGGMLTPSGNVYPGITRILGSFPNPGLDAWRKRVGEAEADRIMKKAAFNGRNVHSIVENHLKGNNVTLKTPIERVQYDCVKQFTNKYIEQIHGIEVPLYSDELQAVGFADLICTIKGSPSRLSVVDFKTSLKPKQKNYVEDYFIQLTSYSFMIRELFDQEIDDLVLVIVVENQDQPQYFHDSFAAWEPKLKQKVDQYATIKENSS